MCGRYVSPSESEIERFWHVGRHNYDPYRILAFAGVMSLWTPSDSETSMLTFSILTRAAEGPASHVHDRMPVILPDEVQSDWIDPNQTYSEKVLALAQEKAVTAVEHYRVSQRVNNAKNEGAELIEPVANLS